MSSDQLNLTFISSGVVLNRKEVTSLIKLQRVKNRVSDEDWESCSHCKGQSLDLKQEIRINKMVKMNIFKLPNKYSSTHLIYQ